MGNFGQDAYSYLDGEDTYDEEHSDADGSNLSLCSVVGHERSRRAARALPPRTRVR